MRQTTCLAQRNKVRLTSIAYQLSCEYQEQALFAREWKTLIKSLTVKLTPQVFHKGQLTKVTYGKYATRVPDEVAYGIYEWFSSQ